MKPYYFLSIFYFCFEGPPAFSQASYLSQDISKVSSSIPLPSVSSDFFANTQYASLKKELNCYDLFKKSWNYESPQAIAICNDAELSCTRYSVLQQFTTANPDKKGIQQNGSEILSLKEALALSFEDVQFKLMACATAIVLGNKVNPQYFTPPSGLSSIGIPLPSK